MNRYAMRGFVLIIVLVFLQLFSLLGWYALTSASMAIKMNEHHWQREKNWYSANQALNDAELNLSSTLPPCMIPIAPLAAIVNEPFSWWQRQGCSGNLNEIRYYYVAEWVGNDPCGVIGKGVSNQSITAEYYRITLLALPKKMKMATIILQSTIIKGNHDNSSCRGQSRLVTVGRQMWREWIGRKAKYDN
jgi:Tfp pilus assembly protein PilX